MTRGNQRDKAREANLKKQAAQVRNTRQDYPLRAELLAYQR